LHKRKAPTQSWTGDIIVTGVREAYAAPGASAATRTSTPLIQEQDRRTLGRTGHRLGRHHDAIGRGTVHGTTTVSHHPVPKSRGSREVVPMDPICQQALLATFTNSELHDHGMDIDGLFADPTDRRFVDGWRRRIPISPPAHEKAALIKRALRLDPISSNSGAFSCARFPPPSYTRRRSAHISA
jgi:hypothetical protein